MAEIVKAEVAVSKEAYELGVALCKLVIDVKKATADGVSAADLPALMASLMSVEIVEGIKGIEKLPEELKDNKGAFVSAFVVAAVKLAEELK